MMEGGADNPLRPPGGRGLHRGHPVGGTVYETPSRRSEVPSTSRSKPYKRPHALWEIITISASAPKGGGDPLWGWVIRVSEQAA